MHRGRRRKSGSHWIRIMFFILRIRFEDKIPSHQGRIWEKNKKPSKTGVLVLIVNPRLLKIIFLWRKDIEVFSDKKQWKTGQFETHGDQGVLFSPGRSFPFCRRFCFSLKKDNQHSKQRPPSRSLASLWSVSQSPLRASPGQSLDTCMNGHELSMALPVLYRCRQRYLRTDRKPECTHSCYSP